MGRVLWGYANPRLPDPPAIFAVMRELNRLEAERMQQAVDQFVGVRKEDSDE